MQNVSTALPTLWDIDMDLLDLFWHLQVCKEAFVRITYDFGALNACCYISMTLQ